MLLADIRILHQSELFKIVNYTCHCSVCSISEAEYNDSFNSHAKTLLKTTGLPVKDIAFECGFNSPEHFVTSYKKNFLEGPTAFRRQFA